MKINTHLPLLLLVSPLALAMEKPREKVDAGKSIEQEIDTLLSKHASASESYFFSHIVEQISQLLQGSNNKIPDPQIIEKANNEEFNGKLIKKIAKSFALTDKYYSSVVIAGDLSTPGAQKWLASKIKKNEKYKKQALERLYSGCFEDKNIKEVEFFINAGAPVNEICNFLPGMYETPLIYAARKRNLKIIQALLNANADLFLVDEENSNGSAFDYAFIEYKIDGYLPEFKKAVATCLKQAVAHQLARQHDSYMQLLLADIRNELIQFWHPEEGKGKL